ncbi:Inversin [Durusdinium trenchii]|uniref:Inversin n=2 Tax=Durusdinium trenchii TaxID=1381693 RepID=A0ABP0QAM1_9DINO
MGDLSPAEERRQVLLYAAGSGRADIISMAIEQETAEGGDVASLLTSQDEKKGTALHEACRNGHLDVVRLLLLRGAPADARDGHGQSPFQVAAECPEKFEKLRGAFEAELFKRCATGDTAGAEALAKGGMDLKCTQAGYSPWAWARLFDATDTADRMEAIASGAVAAVDLDGEGDGDDGDVSRPGEGQSPENEEGVTSICDELCALDLLLWPPVSAFSFDAEVFLSLGESLQVEVHMPPLDVPSASMLFEKLQCCLQAVAPVGEFLPTAPALVPVLSSDSSEAAALAGSTTVTLYLDQSTDGFQVKLAGEAPGTVQLVGGSIWALSQAIEKLRQLLLLHRRPSLDSARLPALCLHGKTNPTPSAAWCSLLIKSKAESAVLMDLWDLSSEEQLQALQQMARWQIRQFWVPVPHANFSYRWLQDVFEARRICSHIGAELVPVIDEKSDTVALAQFQGANNVGWRLQPNSSAECHEVWPTLRSAGHTNVRLTVMVALDKRKALQQVNQLCKDLARQSSRIGLLLECELHDLKLFPMDQALKIGFAHGTALGVLFRERRGGQLGRLPPHVWHPPTATASQWAATLWEKTRSISEVFPSFSKCLVLEVPVFGAPWAGRGTAWRPSWCLLSSFLAAGMHCSSEVEATRLPQLLQGQFFGDSSGSLAWELWNASASLDEDFLTSLFSLLAGEMPRLDDEGISSANAWYAHLTERRLRLRRFRSEGEAPLPARVPGRAESFEGSRTPCLSAGMLASSLVGIEWLRFACRVYLLLAKHSRRSSPDLHSSLQALPPAKQSDVRNGFLALLHRTIHGVVDLPENGWWEESEAMEAEASQAEALWAGGLRLGAALDLHPWQELEKKRTGKARMDLHAGLRLKDDQELSACLWVLEAALGEDGRNCPSFQEFLAMAVWAT